MASRLWRQERQDMSCTSLPSSEALQDSDICQWPVSAIEVRPFGLPCSRTFVCEWQHWQARSNMTLAEIQREALDGSEAQHLARNLFRLAAVVYEHVFYHSKDINQSLNTDSKDNIDVNRCLDIYILYVHIYMYIYIYTYIYVYTYTYMCINYICM